MDADADGRATGDATAAAAAAPVCTLPLSYTCLPTAAAITFYLCNTIAPSTRVGVLEMKS